MLKRNREKKERGRGQLCLFVSILDTALGYVYSVSLPKGVTGTWKRLFN